MHVNRHKIRVRYSETDKMAIVYHTNYINWFEIGRTEYLRSLGYDYRSLEDKNIWIPVLEADCKYKSPALYDDEIVIETTVEELTRVKIKFGYKILREEVLLVQGFTMHAFTNQNLRPIGLNKAAPEVYNKLLECI